MKKQPPCPPGFLPRKRVRKRRLRVGNEIPSPVRMRRLISGIRLGNAAIAAGFSIARASLLERGLLIVPADLARLDAATGRLAAGVL